MGDDKNETMSVANPLITLISSFSLLNKRVEDKIIAKKKTR
tara:strand:+ start:337 stop:459 length:123 start_codon:yes stop_codon:yes gene_type:complete